MMDSHVDPGTQDRRSAGRYLWWLIVRQRHRVAAGALLSSLWMAGLMLPPYLLSRAVDDGLAPGHSAVLVGWVAALFGAGVLNAWLAIMRHRTMSRIRWDAAFRTARAVIMQATRLGATLPRRVTAGEVVFAAMIALNALAAGAGLIGPWLLGRIIDEVKAGGGVGTVDRLALVILVSALAQLLLTRYARCL